MNTKSALHVLRDRAADDLDAVSQQLFSLQQERQQAVQQQQLLLNYQQDYQQLLSHETQSGIYAYRRDNYQRFLHTVDQALTVQNLSLTDLDEQQQQLLGTWQESKKKLNALQVLLKRRAEHHKLAELRAQQKANDEFAMRQFQGAK